MRKIEIRPFFDPLSTTKNYIKLGSTSLKNFSPDNQSAIAYLYGFVMGKLLITISYSCFIKDFLSLTRKNIHPFGVFLIIFPCFDRDDLFLFKLAICEFFLLTLHKKMRFSVKDFFSKYDQIRSFLRIWSHLLKKSIMENFIFCAV